MRSFCWVLLAMPLLTSALRAQATLEETTAHTTAAVRVRERPDVASPVVRRLAAKTEVYVAKCVNGWCQVSVQDMSGYVPARFLAAQPTPLASALTHLPRATARQIDPIAWKPPPVSSRDLWQVTHPTPAAPTYLKLRLDAAAPVPGPLFEFVPSLNVTCRDTTLQAYLMTQSILLADSNETPVLLYWGGTRPPFEVGHWVISTDHTAAFATAPDEFLRKLLDHPVFGIEFGLYDELARTASFDTRGLRDHLAELAQVCPCFEGLTWSASCEATADSVYEERELDVRPQLISGPALEYPPDLHAFGIEGHVIVAAIIDTTGRVESASVYLVRGANPEFDEAAERYVRAARFRPGRVKGEAVRVLVNIPINFTIRR